jgi:hypothetical protein
MSAACVASQSERCGNLTFSELTFQVASFSVFIGDWTIRDRAITDKPAEGP